MKLYLPHREVELDSNLSYEDRNKAIFELLEESTGLTDKDNNIMTIEEYFRFTWNKSPTKMTMDIIGYYLTKNNFEGEDREVLSKAQHKEMDKGSKRHTTFTSMGYDNQVQVGLVDIEDKQ